MRCSNITSVGHPLKRYSSRKSATRPDSDTGDERMGRDKLRLDNPWKGAHTALDAIELGRHV